MVMGLGDGDELGTRNGVKVGGLTMRIILVRERANQPPRW